MENGVETAWSERKQSTRCWEWDGKRKCGTTKMAMKLVLYGAGAEVDVETGLVLKTIYPVSKLTFKSARGTDLY